jgi:hypothetical protein
MLKYLLLIFCLKAFGVDDPYGYPEDNNVKTQPAEPYYEEEYPSYDEPYAQESEPFTQEYEAPEPFPESMEEPIPADDYVDEY